MSGEGLRSKSELTQRVISAAIMAALALGLAWLGGVLFQLVWAVLAAAVAYEWGRMVEPERAQGLAALVGAGALALVLLGTSGLLVVGVVLAVIGAAYFGARAQRNWMATGAAYALMVFVATALIRGDSVDGRYAILFLFAVVWMTDIGAYFTGRTFGGPKFAPTISPKKTWSGVIGGLVCGIACGMGVLALGGYTLGFGVVLLAGVLSMAVVLGDLFESFLKRRFGVKDAGSLIPGHGGFLDRLDGYVAAAVLALLIGAARGGFADVAGGLIR